ncbi:MAG: HEPN domain-containing protein [Fibrobacteres bacterium]|nr:HEPN domain-containing protein [Fibrobacterota bacterium]
MNESCSKEIIAAIKRAEDSIEDGEILLKEERFIAVVNRAYYSIFYSLSALALDNGFETSKHMQLIGWFNKNFVKTGKVATELGEVVMVAYDQRISGDYDFLSDCSREEAVEALQASKNFLPAIKILLGI